MKAEWTATWIPQTPLVISATSSIKSNATSIPLWSSLYWVFFTQHERKYATEHIANLQYICNLTSFCYPDFFCCLPRPQHIVFVSATFPLPSLFCYYLSVSFQAFCFILVLHLHFPLPCSSSVTSYIFSTSECLIFLIPSRTPIRLHHKTILSELNPHVFWMEDLSLRKDI